MYRFTPQECASIGRYAYYHGVAAATCVYSAKLKIALSKPTVQSIRDVYRAEVNIRIKLGESGVITSLPERKRGRSKLVGDDIDNKVQLYIRNVRVGGGIVSARVVMGAAQGILEYYGKEDVAKLVNRHWAYSLLKRMNFVCRKATTAKSKYSPSDFADLKKSFLQSVVETVTMEEISPQLILNWDQTGINIVPSSCWSMAERDSRRIELVGLKDKRQITAVFCCTIEGDFLPVQLIYKGTTRRCHPKHKFPTGWDITHSKKHWSKESTMIQYIRNVIIPYVNRIQVNDNEAALIIMDNFKGQTTPFVTTLLEENNIHVCLLPPNTTDRLQPLDVAVNKPAKEFYRQKFQEWYSRQVSQQIEELDGRVMALQPVNMGLPLIKELGAKWIEEMADYISNNPQFAV